MNIETLLTCLKNPDLHRVELEAMLHQIKGSAEGQHRIEWLVKAVTMEREDQLTDQECIDLLPDYYQADLEGQAGEPRWRAVALHLESCPYCSTAYALLSDLIDLAIGERGVEPPDYPEPDLSFLWAASTEAPQTTSRAWGLDELGRLILEFSTELVSAWQLPAQAMAGLKSEGAEKVLGQARWEREGVDLEVEIIAKTQPDEPSRCTIMVEANIPSRGGWPNLADTKVTLKRRDKTELDMQLTNAFGQALFEGVDVDDLPELVFQVIPEQGQT